MIICSLFLRPGEWIVLLFYDELFYDELLYDELLFLSLGLADLLTLYDIIPGLMMKNSLIFKMLQYFEIIQ